MPHFLTHHAPPADPNRALLEELAARVYRLEHPQAPQYHGGGSAAACASRQDIDNLHTRINQLEAGPVARTARRLRILGGMLDTTTATLQRLAGAVARHLQANRHPTDLDTLDQITHNRAAILNISEILAEHLSNDRGRAASTGRQENAPI